MKSRRIILKLWKLVQRENASRLMLISLLSFLATVILVRSFLALTGYPQIGGKTIHIAHVLWGGLILYIAAILPLIYLNPRLHDIGAVLSGVGVGLFIDEVGKFITRQYDYFYPAAAPIIYVFFLLVIILVIMINRPVEIDGRAELVQALETVREQLYRPLDRHEKGRFEKDIGKVIDSDPNQLHVDLAMHLLEFMHGDVRVVPESTPPWWMRIAVRLENWLVEWRFRWILSAGLVVGSVIALKNPIQVWLERTISDSVLLEFIQRYFGRQVGGIDAPVLYNLRLGLEVIIGVLLFISLIFLLAGRRRLGINLAYLCMLVSLAILDMLLFYFEQFSSVLYVAFQFALLFGLMHYRKKYLQSKL